MYISLIPKIEKLALGYKYNSINLPPVISVLLCSHHLVVSAGRMYSNACLRQRLWAYVFLALSHLNHFLLRLCGGSGGCPRVQELIFVTHNSFKALGLNLEREWSKNTCHVETYLSSWDSAHPCEACLNPDKRIWCKEQPVLRRTESKPGTAVGSHNWEPSVNECTW